MALASGDSCISMLYGPPIAGAGGAVTLSSANQTVSMAADRMIVVSAYGGNAFIGMENQTAAANRMFVPSGGSLAFRVGREGATLNCLQGPDTGGTLYYSFTD